MVYEIMLINGDKQTNDSNFVEDNDIPGYCVPA